MKTRREEHERRDNEIWCPLQEKTESGREAQQGYSCQPTSGASSRCLHWDPPSPIAETALWGLKPLSGGPKDLVGCWRVSPWLEVNKLDVPLWTTRSCHVILCVWGAWLNERSVHSSWALYHRIVLKSFTCAGLGTDLRKWQQSAYGRCYLGLGSV